MKVLICEDEEIMLTAIEFRLRKFGFEVARAKDGLEAIEKLKEKPDLVVADLVIPHLNGVQLVQHIRKELKSDLPIIVITPLDNDEDMLLDAFKHGATDFITKPFKPKELILRIQLILQAQN